MRIRLLPEAERDLEIGADFYESQQAGLGVYFNDCLASDIESLKLYAGIHENYRGFYRSLSKRFPFSIYYLLNEDCVEIYAAQPKSNQVYVKIIMPTDPADRDQDRPVVESWIAEDLKKLGQAKFTAVTEWVPLDLSPFEGTKVWDGNLGDKSYCPVEADIPDRAEGRIKVLLKGWSPGGAYVTVSLRDEPGSRAIAALEELKTEQGMPYVAVLIGPPTEKPAPTDRKK